MTIYWHSIKIGNSFSTGCLTLGKEDILGFAAKFDPQPYHLDSKAANASIFGGLCASGWQISATMMRLLTDTFRQQDIAIIGMDKVFRMRWKIPVFAGDSLSARITLTGRDPDCGQAGLGGVFADIQVQNQDNKVVINLSTRLLIDKGEVSHAN